MKKKAGRPTKYTKEDCLRMGMGDRTDAEVAKSYGMKRQQVHQLRARYGIPPFGRRPAKRVYDIDWEAVGLGERPDGDIAEEVGCHRCTVAYHRARLGADPFERVSIKWLVLEHLKDNPEMPFSDVGKALGVSPVSIQRALWETGDVGREVAERPDIDWESHRDLFYRHSDTHIARMFKVRRQVVTINRRKLGIPPIAKLERGF